MLLSHKTTLQLNPDELNILGHMCYAAYKLWNICNYERIHYKELDLADGASYPNWYYQKKYHKSDLWYKQLPSQTAQEVCKQLDKAWKSFYVLQKTGNITNPQPPRFKHDGIAVTYMQNAIVHEEGSDIIRLSLSKQFKEYMSQTYGIDDNYLFLKNRIFKNVSHIKQIKIYPPVHNKCNVIVVYEVDDVEILRDNGRYLSIDLGLHNLMTCYDSSNGRTFIVGRKYLSLCHYYNKEIARVQSQWYQQQDKHNVQHLKTSKHIRRLYLRKGNVINDYLHKVTRHLADYCKENHIHTVVIGDMTNIRKNKNLGHVTNQKLHSLPFAKIYALLEYKLALYGIGFIKQNEAYSSQTSPLQPKVSKKNACKSNRKQRGLYKDGRCVWNADCVGAYNILRLYMDQHKKEGMAHLPEIAIPEVIKVAV